MPYTKGRYEQGTPVTDGILIVGPDELNGIVAADSVLTRNAAGDYSLNTGATKTITVTVPLGRLLQRSGLGRDIQEQFGGTGIAGDAGQPGRYGTAYTGDPIVPRTTFVKKGVKFTGVKVVELITGAALLAHTCRLDKVVYANNVALAITSILASGANGLPTATQANPYVTSVAFAGTDFIQDLEDYVFELGVQTQGAGAYRLYRLEFQFTYNVN